MHVSLGNVIAGTAIAFLTVIIFFLGISHENKVAKQATAEATAIERPCRQTQEEYLAKIASYLTLNDQWTNGERNTALVSPRMDRILQNLFRDPTRTRAYACHERPISFKSSTSPIIFTPSFFALSAFDPGSAPTTT